VEGGQDSATLIADLNPGPAGSSPRDSLYHNQVGAGQLSGPPQLKTGFHRSYLIATPASGGPRLHKLSVQTLGPWGQGGTPSIEAMDTQPLAASGSNPGSGVFAGTTVVYSAASTGHGREIWRSGGHPSNTGRIADVRPGAVGSDPRDVTAVGDRAFFTADDGEHGRELWTAAVGRPSTAGIAGPSQPTSTTPSEFTVRVAGLAATTKPTGKVTIWDGDKAVATRALPQGGDTVTWTTTLSPGPHRLTATFSGDQVFAPATSTPWLVTVP
jgi:ELWxxDGT repeat protein